MKVIKVVRQEEDGRLVSTFAPGEWKTGYAKGVEAKPEIGYLFAYPREKLDRAMSDMPGSYQYWIAEAKIVGKISRSDFWMDKYRWVSFWDCIKLRLRYKGAPYLLCSSITLTKRMLVEPLRRN